MDEIPVGQKSDANQMFAEELPPETATDKSPDSDLPLVDRLLSKTWGVRATAFTQLATQFSEAPANCANDTFKDQSAKFATYLATDNNPSSLEKCLDAFAIFINQASQDLVSANQSSVLKVLIEKCLVHAKPIIKQKSLDSVLAMFEISENFKEDSLDALEEMLNSKKLPVQIASTGLLAHLLQGFGVKRFPLAQFQKHIETMANHPNPAARSEAMNCYKAIYLWLGDKIEVFIESLKPQVKTQLKEDFPKHKEKHPDFKRQLRSERGTVSATAEVASLKEEEVKQEDGVDMYDIVKAKEILTKFGTEWIEEVSALKVWSQKKSKLEQLINEIDTAKLQQGDYSALVELLKKLVGDNHCNVQQLAVKSLGLFARGLRDGFHQQAKDLFPFLIQKLKDKKLVDEVQAAFKHFLWSLNLGQIVDPLSAGLKDKLPMIQRQTLIFIEQSLHVTYRNVVDEIKGEIQPLLIQLTDSFDTETKEQSLKTLGVLCGRLGTLDKLDLPAAKKNKIEEAAQTVQPSKYDKHPVQVNKAFTAQTKPKREIEKKAPLQLAGDEMDSPMKSPEQIDSQPEKANAPSPSKFKQVDDFELKKGKKDDTHKAVVQVDEMPIKAMKPNAFSEADELPIKAMKPNAFNDADELPIKAMKPNAFNDADELPIKSMKQNAFNEADEQPPVGFASKPPPKRKVVENDQEMLEQPKPATKKPPALSQKPVPKKPVANPTAGKAASVGGGDEEDSGGLSKEEAIEKVEQFFPQEIVSLFDQEKWQDKVQGFKSLQESIIELKPDSVMIEAICRFMKAKMKDWKESNMNMIKETVFTLKTIVENCERVPKRALFVCSAFLVDKIGDSKYAAIKEVFMLMADFVTAKFVGQQIIKHATTTKAVNNLKESCNILTSLLDEWGGSMMPVKECIDYATLACAHSNVQVRNAAMALFAMLYKHLGETVRPFLTDIKESTMKVVEEEFKKITPLKKGEFKSSRALKGDAVEEVKESGGSLEDSLPREDITKHLTAKLLAGFKSKEWKTRKDTAEQVAEILKAAKMRIMPTGLNDLMEALKAGMKESNKAVVKAYIQLLGQLADAIGAPIKLWTKKCLVPMLFNLSDKQSLVRADVIESMAKWSEAIGPSLIVQYTCLQLETENPELRDEGLKWIQAHKDGIKDADHQSMVKPLVDCLTDKVSKIRLLAEEIIVEVMSWIGFEPFQRQAKNLKTAVQQAVLPILEKAKSKAGTPAAAPEVVMEETKEPQQAKRPQTAVPKGPTLKQPPGPTLKQPPGPTLNQPSGPTLKPKEEAPQRTNDTFNKSIPKTQDRPMTSRALPSRGLAATNDEETILIVNAGNKERRAQIDAKSKWLHEDIKPEQSDKVKHFSEQLFGLEFMQKMFSSDFKKHNEVLKAFQELQQTQPQNLKDTLDIIIKWSCIKLAESSNTSFALAVFEFYQSLTEFLVENDYQLLDTEAAILVPMLCDKSGLNNAILKEKVKKVIRQVFLIYDDKKCVQLIFKFGVQAKNLKAVAESIEELTIYIKDHGLDNITEKDLQQISRLADSGDKGVRESALTFIGEVYKVLDEEVWRVLGPLNIKVKGLLEGRFKQVKKGTVGIMNRSITGASPLQRKSLVPKQGSAEKSGMNQSLNKSLNKSLVGGQTPRRVPPTTKNTALNSLTKSIKKENPMNSSLNNAPQRAQTLKFQSSSIERPVESANPKQLEHLPSFAPETNNIFQDDDEDLIQLQSEIESQTQQPPEELDPRLKEQVTQIMKHVQSLKYGDLSKRVDSLVALNDIIGQVQKWNQAVVRCSNDLCSAVTHVMVDIFEKPLPDIPLRFAKYFTGIVNRVCSSPDIMLAANERETYELTEQLLVRLLTDQLDKLGDNKEGEIILKTLNAAMLRLLENSQPTFIYCALYNLLKKYKNYTVLPKMPGLVIKCLLKLAKIIEKQASGLQINKILLAIHEYLLVINHDEKSQNDEMGIRITKTVINELVKIKGEQIWESYSLVERHLKADNHISRWIQVILQQPNRSLNDTAPSFGTLQPEQAQPVKDESEIKKIIEELRSTDQFEGGIQKLHSYLQRNPQEELQMHLKDLSSHFSNFIKTHLEQYQHSLVETGATPEPQQSPTRREMVGERRMSPFAQQRLQNSSATQQSRLMQPKNATFNSSGSTGRAPSQIDNQQQQQSSDQRISSYQDKITQMRDKLQKSGSQSNILQETGTPIVDQPVTKPPPSFGLKAQSERQSIIGGVNKDKNTSFSNMNSSLSAKWKQISAPKKSDSTQQLPTVTKTETTAQELNQLRQQNASQGQQATQSDLQTRLAEMKAKLQKINQKKE